MIFIQSNNEKTLPHHFDVACVMYGAIETDQKYKLISYNDVISGKFDNLITNNLFVGSVEFMREVFRRVGINEPKTPTNSNREYYLSTISEIKQSVKLDNKHFIKPLIIKLFTGFVIDQMVYTSLNNIPDDTEVMVYEPFKYNIESEWRCYIYNNKLQYLANYSGDLLININPNYLNDIINHNKEIFPIAYTIDVGVLSNGENVIIEYNDMWAIGNYGLPNDLYLKMLKQRYFEVIKTFK
jgi:hypothetical protein